MSNKWVDVGVIGRDRPAAQQPLAVMDKQKFYGGSKNQQLTPRTPIASRLRRRPPANHQPRKFIPGVVAGGGHAPPPLNF